MTQSNNSCHSFSGFTVNEFHELWAVSFDQLFSATHSMETQAVSFHQIILKTRPSNDYELIRSLQYCFLSNSDPASVPEEIKNFNPNERLKGCHSLTRLIGENETIAAITFFNQNEKGHQIGTFFCEGENGNKANVSHYYSPKMNILSFFEDFCERYDATCKSRLLLKEKFLQNGEDSDCDN